MVEVRAELHGLGVYIAGERVTCAIVFTNQGAMEEIIAWAGAQLHCQYCYREDIVRVDFSQLPLSSPINDTAFVPNRGADVIVHVCMCVCVTLSLYRRKRSDTSIHSCLCALL